uniref:Uncharacterized protein n=1 Tax=Fagus sylvatica TaxID=28930 RepID=A0A2N9FVM4_FAGSY
MKPLSFLPAQKTQEGEYEENSVATSLKLPHQYEKNLLSGFSCKPKTQDTHNSRYNTKRDDVEEVSTKLTLSSCAFQTKPMANKLKPCQTLVASATNPEDGDDEDVSTELTLSCGFQTKPMANKRKSCVTLAASATNPESWFCSWKRKVTTTSTNAPWIIKKRLTESDLGSIESALGAKQILSKKPYFASSSEPTALERLRAGKGHAC